MRCAISASRRNRARSRASSARTGPARARRWNVICGFYRPDAGTVRLGEGIVSALRAHLIPRSAPALRVPIRTSQLLESMSVIDNVTISSRRGRFCSACSDRWQGRRRQAEIAESLLAFVGRARARYTAGGCARSCRQTVAGNRPRASRCARACWRSRAGGRTEWQDTAAIGALLCKLAAAGMTVILVEHDMDLGDGRLLRT